MISRRDFQKMILAGAIGAIVPASALANVPVPKKTEQFGTLYFMGAYHRYTSFEHWGNVSGRWWGEGIYKLVLPYTDREIGLLTVLDNHWKSLVKLRVIPQPTMGKQWLIRYGSNLPYNSFAHDFVIENVRMTGLCGFDYTIDAGECNTLTIYFRGIESFGANNTPINHREPTYLQPRRVLTWNDSNIVFTGDDFSWRRNYFERIQIATTCIGKYRINVRGLSPVNDNRYIDLRSQTDKLLEVSHGFTGHFRETLAWPVRTISVSHASLSGEVGQPLHYYFSFENTGD